MKFEFDAVVISTLRRESKGKEYFQVNVDQNGEIVTLPCTPDVAKHVADNKYKPYHFEGQYVRGEFDGRIYTRMTVTNAQIGK